MHAKTFAQRSALVACFAAACASDTSIPADAIIVGAALPFSGSMATTGGNLERALALAVEDVNAAGGVGGRELYLQMRDSNSGSARGLDQVLRLLYDDQVDFLIGPEENNLASEVVRDIKGLDRLQLLPGYAAPGIKDSGTVGAWVMLAPPAPVLGCALATKAYREGARTANVVTTRDEYHLELASNFSSVFTTLGGVSLPMVTVEDGLPSYSRAILQTREYDADISVLFAYPKTAASIVTESAAGSRIRWLLSPLLHDEAFLWNVPGDLLEGSQGTSPSLSHDDECVAGPDGSGDVVACRSDRAAEFEAHFSERWSGDAPLAAAHFYYDSVIFLALALEQLAAEGNPDPSPQEIRRKIVALSSATDEAPVLWHTLPEGLALAASGAPIHYVGVAGEYSFNRSGRNGRMLVSSWMIDQQQFMQGDGVVCPVDVQF